MFGDKQGIDYSDKVSTFKGCSRKFIKDSNQNSKLKFVVID